MNDKLPDFKIFDDRGENMNAIYLRGLLIGDLSTVQNGDTLLWNTTTNSWNLGTPDPVIQFTGSIPNRAIYIGDIKTTNQSANSLAFGNYAGNLNQGFSSIAFGENTGENNQGSYSIALGYRSGQNNQ